MAKKTRDLIETFVFDEQLMENLLKDIGRRIQKFRSDQNLSMNDLAQRVNMSYSHLYKIETGSANIGIKTLIKISMVLQVPLVEIIPIDEKMYQSEGNKYEILVRPLTERDRNYIMALVRDLSNTLKFKNKQIKHLSSVRKEEEYNNV